MLTWQSWLSLGWIAVLVWLCVASPGSYGAWAAVGMALSGMLLLSAPLGVVLFVLERRAGGSGGLPILVALVGITALLGVLILDWVGL